MGTAHLESTAQHEAMTWLPPNNNLYLCGNFKVVKPPKALHRGMVKQNLTSNKVRGGEDQTTNSLVKETACEWS